MTDHQQEANVPPIGPEPLLLKRTQVDALYHLLQAVVSALDQCYVDDGNQTVSYIITGGSLLGAVRQHSILFTDDDVDIAIVQGLAAVRAQLPALLGPDYRYTVQAWEGSDRIRWTPCSNVFLDVFGIREYRTIDDLRSVLSLKKNGQAQTDEYVNTILHAIATAMKDGTSDNDAPLFPCWHFDRRKAVELWPREVYRPTELFPIRNDYCLGPVVNIAGPHQPITLLQRAFGADCFTHYYCSTGHDQKKKARSDENGHSDIVLPPHVRVGGTWEGTPPQVLLPEHYVPMQPTSRAQRRWTLHGKEQFLVYLQQQSLLEANVITQPPISMEDETIDQTIQRENTTTTLAFGDTTANGARRPRRTVYMDGVFDLFHTGHVRAIEQCVPLGDRLILGVTGDADAARYKRAPVMHQADRVAVVAALRHVDRVICPCPLIVTTEFLDEHAIDLVVHGFADDADAERQRSFFRIPEERGQFQRIDYYHDLSTTSIIQKIQSLSFSEKDPDDAPDPMESTPRSESIPQSPSTTSSNWFGATLSSATKSAAEIPFDPFPLSLRIAIAPHIDKARAKQSAALEEVGQKFKITLPQLLQQIQASSPLATEGVFSYDTSRFPLRETLLRSGGFPEDFNLVELHLLPENKDDLLRSLTSNYRDFQNLYDHFVREVCAPRFVAGVTGEIHEIYYQAFPCIRVVQPGEFSIGPHSDITYGHHAGSINLYLPLTNISGSAALFLESRFGSEDWHPILGTYGTAKHFAGASCLHWTTNNTAGYTRVSLDFRLIAGNIFHALTNSGLAYRHGFYCRCRIQENGAWERVNAELPVPDKRTGFPWTVKDWDMYNKKK